MFILLLILGYSRRRMNWFISFIICSIANFTWKFISGCFHNSGLVKNWTTFTKDCIIDRGTSSMLSSFSLTTFVISLNVSAYSYLICCYNFNNKPMVKCCSTNALIPTKIGLVLSWPYALKHPWSLIIFFPYTLSLTLKPLTLINLI